ncbi:MAG TPA: outer membrane lipid asymmetry maintenance protein MlaD [Nitrospiraceae bacterium]|jgi:phospholipid/cholesterol/gamma-HCH transport system substrate-binding protein|nr:outer membrane lipid asymmetry maintenance protein MlaD [Nitrospiraceae bacterium]
MEKTKLEMVVGVFVLVGLLCLAYLSVKLGKLELIGGGVYEVEAQFNSASGLKPGSAIEIAGVEVGRVRGITLNQDRAMVKLAVNNTIKLYTDTIASIKTRGIIGEKFLALSPGGGGDPLKPGDTIRDTESGLDLEELVSQFVHGNVK